MLAPLDELGKAVEEAGKLLTDQPITAVSDRDLVDFRQEMLRQDALLEKWSSKLEEAVRTTYGSEKELERMEAVWTLTEQRAAAEGAAPAILARAQSVRGEIHDLGKSVRARLDRLLAAQDRVASLRIRILAWMEAANRADAIRERQLFEIEARPIWEVLSRKQPFREFGDQLSRVFQHNVSTLPGLRARGGVRLPLGPGRLRGRGGRHRLDGEALRRPRRRRPRALRAGRGGRSPRRRRDPRRAQPHLLAPSDGPGGLHRAVDPGRAALAPPARRQGAPRGDASPALRLHGALRRHQARRRPPRILAGGAAPHPPRRHRRPRRDVPVAPEGTRPGPRRSRAPTGGRTSGSPCG